MKSPRPQNSQNFPTVKATVPSDITAAFSSADRFHTHLHPPLRSHLSLTENLMKKQPDVIIGESTSRVPPTTLEDVVAKETETDIDREYFTLQVLLLQPTRPPTVEGKAFGPQAFSTPGTPSSEIPPPTLKCLYY